jgi:hypothetical protein
MHPCSQSLVPSVQQANVSLASAPDLTGSKMDFLDVPEIDPLGPFLEDDQMAKAGDIQFLDPSNFGYPWWRVDHGDQSLA